MLKPFFGLLVVIGLGIGAHCPPSWAASAEPTAIYEARISEGFFSSLARPYLLRMEVHVELPTSARVETVNEVFDDRPSDQISVARYSIGRGVIQLSASEGRLDFGAVSSLLSASMSSPGLQLAFDSQVNTSAYGTFDVSGETGRAHDRFQAAISISGASISGDVSPEGLLHVSAVSALPSDLQTSWQLGFVDPANGMLSDHAIAGFVLLHRVR